MKDLVVILIIAHKAALSDNEKRSLKQCYDIFHSYPIKLICPEGLDVSEYKKVCSEVDVEYIDPKWQVNYEMFNRLKIDKLLYQKFIGYKHILFYELDAWVFRDDLVFWCSRDFDFIGAPWFEGDFAGNSTNIIGTGNGGFSLRNTASSLRLLKRIRFIRKWRNFWYASHLQSLFRVEKMISFSRHFFKIKDVIELSRLLVMKEMMHEDRYWARVGQVFYDFKIAPVTDALQFSFEVQPAYLFKKNNYQLPFGCHAWERCEPGFWKQFIPTTA